jgi:hypothetical protein
MGSSRDCDYAELKDLNTISNGVWPWVEMFYRSDPLNFGLMELLRLNLLAFELPVKWMVIQDTPWGKPT